MQKITLPSRVDRRSIENLLPDLIRSIGNGPVTIDGSDVVHIGQSGLQVLVSAMMTAAVKGHSIILEPSASLREMVRMAGLTSLLLDRAPA